MNFFLSSQLLVSCLERVLSLIKVCASLCTTLVCFSTIGIILQEAQTGSFLGPPGRDNCWGQFVHDGKHCLWEIGSGWTCDADRIPQSTLCGDTTHVQPQGLFVDSFLFRGLFSSIIQILITVTLVLNFFCTVSSNSCRLSFLNNYEVCRNYYVNSNSFSQ